MSLDLVTFAQLAGVHVQPAPRKIGRAFLAALEAALEDLWTRSGLGRAERIVHMGAYVDRPDPAGTDRHAQGRAIDLAILRWPAAEGRPAITVRADDPGRSSTGMRRYLAVSAVLELHLGCVLNFWQPDNKHRSHWHLDDHRERGWSPGWRPSVRFLQAALTHVWGLGPLAVDGDYGPRTRAAARDACQQILAEDLTVETWPALLEATARRGFGGG